MIKIRYRYSCDGTVPLYESSVADFLESDATDGQILAEVTSCWGDRSDYSPPRLIIENEAEVIAAVRAAIARQKVGES
jgi:hypothetical protein